MRFDHTVVVDLGGLGHLVEVQSVNAPARRFALTFDQHPNGRTAAFFQTQCGDGCDAGSASSPPRGQATPPPNYDACSKAGGAAWYNSLTGSNGCVQGAGEQPLSCGTYKWSSPGKGKLIFNDGSILDNIDWAIDHGESGCTLG
jgi:hypothetical protein